MEAESAVLDYDGATGADKQASVRAAGDLLITPYSAKYADMVRRGIVFSGQTAGTGVSPGTAIGTTAAITLFNPAGTAKNLVVLRAAMGYVSGTLPAGAVLWAANTNPAAAAVTGTEITPVKAFISVTSPGASGKLYTTATLPATPTLIRPFCSLTPVLASSVIWPYVVREDVDGEFIVAPGCALSLEGLAGAGGSSPLVVFGITWAEVPA